MKPSSDFFSGKTVLVSGGAGSIGSALVRELLRRPVKSIRVLDNNETGLFELGESLRDARIRLLVGDVVDRFRLQRALEGVDIVFHVAALKHVPLCDYNPFEAARVNIVGTQNVIDAAIKNDVEVFITVSTDKAANPSSVMGATKLLAEKLTSAANLYKGGRRTRFASVRFGNVLNSRGSMIPTFRKHLKQENKVYLSHPDMTRFVMTVDAAVGLVLRSAELARGGETFIARMDALRVKDLAEVMISLLGNGDSVIETSGKRPGEKLSEELFTANEAERIVALDDVLVLLPETIDLKKYYASGKRVVDVFSSATVPVLSKADIRRLLQSESA